MGSRRLWVSLTSTAFNLNGNWWDDAYNDQNALDMMVSSSIRNLSGKADDTASWDALFKNFNQRNGKANIGYQPGEKIAIKINQNNTTSHASNNQIDASPHLILSLLKSLVNSAGVSQSDITVFDSSRFITDNIYTKCHSLLLNKS